FKYRHQGQDTDDTQRRSLINWCQLFAKPGKWKSVRSLALWTRLDEDGRLRVAIHKNLFGQIRRAAPCESHRRFAALAERYDVGTLADGRPGGSRAVDIDPSFVAELLAGPVDGTVDGRASHDADEGLPSTVPSTATSSES